MDNYKEEPANPDPPFEWLVNLLPASKREGPSFVAPPQQNNMDALSRTLGGGPTR